MGINIRVGQKAQGLSATAVFAEGFLTAKLSDYFNKKYAILFLKPVRFYFCCPIEINAFIKIFEEFGIIV